MVYKNMQATVLKGVEEQISADEPKGITQVFNRLKKKGIQN
ncbi:hypothetical protein [Salipaludibacillus aurantiacus]|uniref:Uncharacterized protein n=1 Tax=Salipaludibacillus aurantiacus TaxID=1601833 RepID=A0A1H9S4Q9_9BACI|nr:hypothetical protein [Salipaludibacillus aurantiacus]SER79605.1 hypothetical protein SAMN05518684_10410 [Salipaludibacillus aurantiacus]